MQIAKNIVPKEWMTDLSTIKIMSVLGSLQSPPQSLFVGGCVRNTLLDLPVLDVDIATIHSPEKVLELCKYHNIKCIPTGFDHGTVTAIFENRSFEITTLRADIDTDGRHAVVKFSQDWIEDARRRDFTINTLLMDIDGNIYDPTGSGLKDLDRRNVVFVGDADKRISEDYLRILRYFRFFGTYGRGSVDEGALAAIKKHADKINLLSKERVTQEFLKILGVKNTSDVLTLMLKCSVLKDLQKDFVPQSMIELCKFQDSFEIVDVLARLVLFCGFDCTIATQTLSLSNAQKKHMDNITKCFQTLIILDSKNIHRAIYWYGNNIATQSYILRCVLSSLSVDVDILDIAKYWAAPVFPITGNDLMAKGYLEGAALGLKLKALEAQWVDGDFKIMPKF